MSRCVFCGLANMAMAGFFLWVAPQVDDGLVTLASVLMAVVCVIDAIKHFGGTYGH